MTQYLKIFFEILVAGFGVYGFYCFLSVFFHKAFGRRNLVLALEILNAEDAENVDLMIRELMSGFSCPETRRIALIVSEEVLCNENLQKTVTKYSLDCYVID